MIIRDAPQDMEKGRVLRVTIPVRQHIQLHKFRLLIGKNMSEVVQEALDLYFEAYRKKAGSLDVPPGAAETDGDGDAEESAQPEDA